MKVLKKYEIMILSFKDSEKFFLWWI